MIKDYVKVNELKNLVEEKLQSTTDLIKSQSLNEPYKYLIANGGKRFRPVVSMLTSGIICGDHNVSLNQSTALELLHNFTLVHDDIMDKSPLRRGVPTIHEKWDDSVAILLGDLIIGISCKVFKEGLTKEKMYAMNIFNDSLIEVCMGQAFDMDFCQQNDINTDEYFDMISKKTGSLIRASMLIGGYMAGASKEDIDKLNRIATDLGFAFQLQDDLLDITGDTNKFGKKIGQDIIEGKKTFMIIRTKEESYKKGDTELIDKFYQNDGLTSEEIPNITKQMYELGIIEETKSLISNYFDEAFSLLSTFPESEYKNELEIYLKRFSKRNI